MTADTGFSIPNGHHGEWMEGENAFVSDDNYAWTDVDNTAHYWTDYSITGDGVVDSVELGVEYWQEGGADDVIFRVTWDGGDSWGAPHIPGLNPADPNTVEWFNITADPGIPWTWSMLSDANFQVFGYNTCFGMPCGFQYVDWIPVRLYWTPNTAPTIDGASDYAQVTVENFHDRLFTASDSNSDALTWTLTTDCPELSLWQDNWTAGVQGVPKTIGVYYVLLTVQDAWDSATFNYSLTVTTRDILACTDCYITGKIGYRYWLNVYSFKLNVTSSGAVIERFIWDFGDGVSANTTEPFVEHTYWVGAFMSENVTVTVHVLTSSGASQPITRDVTVNNAWQLWGLLFFLVVGAYLVMRYVSRVYAKQVHESG